MIIFGEIRVRRESQTFKNFSSTSPNRYSFLFTSPKRVACNQGKEFEVIPYVFGRDIFAILDTSKGHLAASVEQMVRLEVLRR